VRRRIGVETSRNTLQDIGKRLLIFFILLLNLRRVFGTRGGKDECFGGSVGPPPFLLAEQARQNAVALLDNCSEGRRRRLGGKDLDRELQGSDFRIDLGRRQVVVNRLEQAVRWSREGESDYAR
jgi:hypothetical protein